MSDIPAELRRQLHAYGQSHVLAGWSSLSPAERESLAAQLSAIDLAELAALVEQAQQSPLSRSGPPEPIPVAGPVATAEECAAGSEAISRGEIAALIVAGGQGSRLGFDRPKGMFPVGPVSAATLFQIHAEKVRAQAHRHGKPIPLLVMTSPATDAETRTYFEESQYFGLGRENVIFFQQGTMPSVCARSGRLLLEAPGRLFLSPNGHGGTVTALAERGIFDQLRERGARHLFYFQVDNPLVKVCDPGFVGRHLLARSEASSKVVFKEASGEKVGVFAVLNGRCGMIEYSDLAPELATSRAADGTLRFRAGSPAIHLFDLAFLERVTRTGGLPYHVARKAVAHHDPETNRPIDAGPEPNAFKFERFIFDALPLAERWLAVETPRAEEFAPLKNATGADSPESVRAAQIALFGRWLQEAGFPAGEHPVEISPLFALDAAELKSKMATIQPVTGPTYLR